jgi:hypothetical protein
MRGLAKPAVFALIVTALATLTSAAGNAQNTRSFVSGLGSDSNPCTLAAPCRTFAQAISQTDTGGEITVLDSAGYGPVLINKGISIVNPGGIEAGITATNTSVFAIGVSSGVGQTVALRGLTLEGGGSAYDGIQYNGQGRIEIVDCVIRNFTHDGIDLNIDGQSPGTAETLSVSNTIASDNGSSGIEVNGLYAFRGAIDHVTTDNNGQSGITIDGTKELTGGFMDVTISGSTADSNGNNGITVQGTGDVKVDLRTSTLSNSTSNGLSVSDAKVGISKNSIVMNGAGFSITSSGVLTSFGDNVIENNRGANTGTLTAASLQ